MTAEELLDLLRRRGVKLWADGDHLRYSAPRGVVTSDLRGQLAQHKAAILSILRRSRGTKDERSAAIRRVSRALELPLSFAQERLWHLYQLRPGDPAYNIQLAVRISGPLDVDALRRSFEETIKRHEVLRMTCSSLDGDPALSVAPDRPLAFPTVDLRDCAEEDRESEIARLATEGARRPFDLSQSPLLRMTLLQPAPQQFVLLVTTHQFAMDGWSIGVLCRDIASLYEAFARGGPSPLAPLEIQYVDYAHWQRRWLQGEPLERQLTYWKKQLAGASVALDLPTDRPRPAVPSLRGVTHHFALPADLSEAIRALSRRQCVTVFMTLLSALQTVLHRYTSQDDVVVCTDVSNRGRIETEALIGPFTNTLLLRGDFSGGPTFRELLRRTKEVATGAYAHEDLPIERVLEELGHERRSPRRLLPQAMFIFHQSTPEQDLKLPGLTVTRFPVETGTTRFDLSLVMTQGEPTLSGALQYRTELFDATTVRRMVEDFETVLRGAVAGVNRSVSSLLPLRELKHRAPFPPAGARRSEAPGLAPRDDLERRLTRIWERLLGVEPIGVQDSFFDLGGHSLLAVRLFTQIEKTVGERLPLTTLLEAPTIEKLARVLRGKTTEASRPCLVPVQPRGSKPPVFGVPEAAGDVLTFASLARRLGPDQPFYSLQAQGLDGRKPPHATVADMASYYVNEIQAAYPKGPYVLVGRCFGGFVAFEMARQLHQQGHRVPLLVLVDSSQPPPPISLRRYLWLLLFHHLPRGQVLYCLARDVREKARKIEWRLTLTRQGRRFYSVWAAHEHARLSYKPDVYPGRITLFQSPEFRIRFPEYWERWSALAGEGLDCHTIPGRHGDLLREPHVKVVADRLTACLAELRAVPPESPQLTSVDHC
ncbi:MAG: alpha/beta fold hydrolase [Planctomycetota bacterium]